MADLPSSARDPRRVLLAIVLLIVPLGLLAARIFEFPGDRVTVGAVVVAALVVIGALALPALILAGWRADGD